MSRERVALRTATLVASGFVGFLAGHSAEYTLLTRNPVRRALLMQSTGHSYWEPAWHAGVFALIFAAGAAIVFGFGRVGDPRARIATRGTTWCLALLQTAGFVGVELAERTSVSAPVRGALGTIVVGVAIQLAFAFVAATALALLDDAGAYAARALAARRPATARNTTVPPIRSRWSPASPAIAVTAPRAPPRLSLPS